MSPMVLTIDEMARSGHRRQRFFVVPCTPVPNVDWEKHGRRADSAERTFALVMLVVGVAMLVVLTVLL